MSSNQKWKFFQVESTSTFQCIILLSTSLISRFVRKGFDEKSNLRGCFQGNCVTQGSILTVCSWWMIAGSRSWRYWEEEEDQMRTELVPGRDVIPVQPDPPVHHQVAALGQPLLPPSLSSLKTRKSFKVWEHSPTLRPVQSDLDKPDRTEQVVPNTLLIMGWISMWSLCSGILL